MSSVGRKVEQLQIIYCWWNCKMAQLFLKNNFIVSYKVDIYLPHDLEILLIYLPKIKNACSERLVCRGP